MTDEPKPSQQEDCLVEGCTNKRSEGKFVGVLCYPCYDALTRGDFSQPTTAAWGDLHAAWDRENDRWQGLVQHHEELEDAVRVLLKAGPEAEEYTLAEMEVERLLAIQGDVKAKPSPQAAPSGQGDLLEPTLKRLVETLTWFMVLFEDKEVREWKVADVCVCDDGDRSVGMAKVVCEYHTMKQAYIEALNALTKPQAATPREGFERWDERKMALIVHDEFLQHDVEDHIRACYAEIDRLAAQNAFHRAAVEYGNDRLASLQSKVPREGVLALREAAETFDSIWRWFSEEVTGPDDRKATHQIGIRAFQAKASAYAALAKLDAVEGEK